MPQLPDMSALADAGRIALIIIGAVMALFGLALYHGAIRLFGGLVGSIFGLLIFLSNKDSLPGADGIGLWIWGFVIPLIGGWIGAWIAEMAHYVLFFLFGMVVGYAAILVLSGQITMDQLSGTEQLESIAGPQGWHWLVMLVTGVVYLAASNWMIMLTTVFVGSSVVAFGLQNPIWMWLGCVFGTLFQYTLFLRREMRSPRRVVHLERRRGVIDSEGNEH